MARLRSGVPSAIPRTESRAALYRPIGSVRSRLMHVSSAQAQAAGLTLTPPEATAQDTRAVLDPAQLAALGHGPEAELPRLFTAD